jgi:pimeloyl-ACP methyl ester carboxylesterase
MFSLNEDRQFHYEAMRAIATVPYAGADVMEVVQAAQKIKPNDFDSWYDEWYQLARRVLSTVDEEQESSYSPVTLRGVYFRASHYFFMADFFLHGNKTDPRMADCFQLWRKYFDKANALLPIPGKRVNLATQHGYEIPIMVFRAAEASASNPRPTLLIGGGFESNMEETFFFSGFAALERGYNVVLYEGPGHRLLIEQGVGFVAEWEQAVNPIMDYLTDNKDGDLGFIDTSKIGLMGMSLGGYLSARAAAFEPRLAALMCIDGVWSFGDALDALLPDLTASWQKGDVDEFNRIFSGNEGEQKDWTSTRRWLHDDLLFGFVKDTGYEAYKVAKNMTLSGGVAERIKMPVFLGDATAEMFFMGQPRKVAQAIGDNATLKVFGEDQGAQLHCQSGALLYMNQEMLEWFAKVVGR